MPIAQVLAEFHASVRQCNNLIANAHKMDATGTSVLPRIDRQQITVAAFLNQFIAWESFLEAALTQYMTGEPTMSGTVPVRYVSPRDVAAAQAMLKGTMRYFDYANHDNVRVVAKLYFENGYPFDTPINGIHSDLNDLKTMRNGSAHISSTTQIALEGLALRIFASPRGGIKLYDMLTAIDPRYTSGETVYEAYQKKLTVTADLIALG